MSRKKIIILAPVVILLAVYGYLGLDYLGQLSEQDRLAAEIADTAQALEEVPQSAQDLARRLALAEAGLSAAESGLPSKADSTLVIDAILRMATGAGLQALPLTTYPWTTEAIGDNDYRVFRLNLDVTGSYSALVSFVSGLESGEISGLAIQDLNVSTVGDEVGGASSQNEPAITARVDIAVYAGVVASE